MREGDYSWVTDDMFQTKLEDIVGRLGTDALMAIPSIHEILSEELNNQVLEELDDDNRRDNDRNKD